MMAYNSGMRDTPRRAKTPSLPLTASDSVSEWSKKIRDIQKEVDADEEAERKKLEDEIAASRLARASRRSTVIAGSGILSGSTTAGVSGSELGNALTKLSTADPPKSPTKAEAEPDLSMLGRSDALRKLVGRDHVNSQGGAAASPPSSSSFASSSSVPASTATTRSDRPYDFEAIRANVPGSKYAPTKGEPISLAAFMGSSAAGPRLNKAPKHEEYNPDLYAPRPDISGPHPIFGRARDPYEKGKPMQGSIPLPGLARQPSPQPPPPEEPPKLSGFDDDWVPRDVDPTLPKRKSVEIKRSSQGAELASGRVENPVAQLHQVARSPSPIKVQDWSSEPHASTPARRTTMTYDEFGSPSSTRAGGIPIERTQSQPQPQSPTSMAKYGSSSLSSTPTLARPILPTPKPPVSPQVAASTRQSPAFLRPPQQKDLTPSLSRLQGRGFVAQRVNVSETIEGGRDSLGGGGVSPVKKGVLSRWPPAGANANPNASSGTSGVSAGTGAASIQRSPPTPESPTRPRAISQIERDREAGIFPGASTPPQSVSRPAQSGPRLGPGAVALPAMAKTKSPTAPARMSRTPEPEYMKPAPPVALPGLAAIGAKSPFPSSDYSSMRTNPGPGPTRTMEEGPSIQQAGRTTGPGSASTMISYIRPQKTGQSERSVHTHEENASTNRSNHSNSRDQANPVNDDDGGKWGVETSKSVLEPSSGHVLSHPTRARAKKPQGMTKKVSSTRGDGGGADVVEERREEEKIGPGNGEGEEDVIVISGASGETAGNHASPAAFAQTAEPTPDLPNTKMRKKYDGGAWDEADEAQIIDEARSFRTTAIPAPSSTDPQPTEETTFQISSRRSAITKYSVSVLPPLTEEPRSLPHSREATGNTDVDMYMVQPVEGMEYMDAKGLEKEIEESSSSDEDEEMVEQHTHVTAPQTASFGDDLITITQADRSLQFPDLSHIHEISEGPFKPNTSFQPISTDAFALNGSQALIPLELKPLTVYDAECVAVVYRVKSRATSLASTKVFCWMGKSWRDNTHERRKLNELAGRHSAPLVYCSQGGESGEFLHVVGNTLATREGSRIHWSIDNMTMHRVRRLYGSTMIDELPFHIGNLCAGFSYILSMLGTIYVWHGKGSLKAERATASSYAQQIKGTELHVVEVRQGKEDENFWMMLGEDFSSADYWRHRDEKISCDPKFFEVLGREDATVDLQHRARFSGLDLRDDKIVVADCSFELFVIIGSQARDQRNGIRSALGVAKHLSKHGHSLQPFPPPIHVVVLPSRLPAELRMALRFMPSDDGSTPDHMNILTIQEAVEQLGTPSWARAQLADETFLPLGVGPSML